MINSNILSQYNKTPLNQSIFITIKIFLNHLNKYLIHQ